jgi:glycosyltransferase involved in cell wall biosynthesis
MKVSIITPCYNAAQYIASTIQSIQQQTLHDWELLIVDDGSVDNSADIIRSMAKDDSRIRLLQKANGGTASARKLGLEHAQGEYIQFLDADDQIDADKLRRQVELMDKEGLQVSYTDWCYMNAQGEKEDLQGLNCHLTRLLAFWGTFGTLPIHCFLYRRDFLEQHHITFTTAIKEREDWDFHIQVYSARPQVKRLKGYCGAFYVIAPEGKTTGATQDKIQIGTFNFLTYQLAHSSTGKRILLYLRFAIELWLWILRKIRYRTPIKLLSHPHFQNNPTFEKALFMGVLLMPVVLIIICIRFIVTRCSTNK